MLYVPCTLANQNTRTLFTSKAGLDHAKDLVSSYKQGKIQSMTPELWQAKKIVDSTLHPGKSFWLARTLVITNIDRHWRTCFSPLPHVILRPVEFGRDSWYAHPKSLNHGHSRLANYQPIAQRRHQFVKRKQVIAHLDLDHGPVILSRCWRKLQCRSRSECSRTET